MAERRGRSPFKVLGVSRGASADRLRRAYLEAARRTHPDHGGDPAAFAEVGAAWRAIQTGARGQADVADTEWGHARTIRHLVDLDLGEIDHDDDKRTTTVRCPGGTLTLDDAGLSARFGSRGGDGDLDRLPWAEVDDGLAEALVELLASPPPPPPAARRRRQD